MKYQVRSNTPIDMLSGEELLKNILNQRGIENHEDFLNPKESHLHSPFLFKNMEAGCELLMKHIKAKSRILILADSDADGITSASIIYQFIQDVSGITCDVITHYKKKHGLYPAILERIDCDLLICPDSASNDAESAKILSERGVEILVLDHHEIECENPYACVINSADGVYPNEALVGAMVTFKFCQAFRYLYDLKVDLTKLLPLAALGQISDMGSLKNPETRLMVSKGLELFDTNEFLRHMCEKQAYSMNNKVTIDSVSWSISPLMNAVIRVGEYEERMDLFYAISGVKRSVEHQARKSKNNPNPQVEVLSLQEFMANRCKTLKSRQDSAVKKGVAIIEKQVEEKQLDNHAVIMVDGTELNQTFTGLVANKLAAKYKRPCLVLRERGKDGEVFGGSGRNYSKHPLDDFRLFLNSSGLVNFASGHSNALGIELPSENVPALLTYADNQLGDIEIDDVYHVDYEIHSTKLSERDVLKVAEYNDIWGGDVERVKFAVTDIYLSSEDIKLLGEKKNIIKFDVEYRNNKISFIKFFANEKLYEKLIHRTNAGFGSMTGKRLKLTVIGEFKINEYNDNQYPQVEIIDMTSEVVAKKVLF